MPIPQGESLNTIEAMSTQNEYEYYDEEEEWGEDDEWEWEESEPEEEEETKEPMKSIKSEKISNGVVKNGSSNAIVNGTMKNGSGTTNGNMTNGNLSNGHAINIEDTEIEEAKGKANIQIEGNLLKIARTGPVDWSDDEYEDEEIAPPPPPPPPPAPAPPPPPPPPPGNEIDEARARKLKKIEALKKRPTVKPDWNGLMKEIDGFRYGFKTRLKKVACDDRSKPMLGTIKIQGKFIYDSEQKGAESDIFFEIKKGVKLKHVRTNDRSKPILQGIRCFRRQTTKEERLKKGSTFEETLLEEDDEDEDMDRLRDDLESTKQLLELELRSKKLLEKDNKRLAQELEKLRMEVLNGGGARVVSTEAPSNDADETNQKAVRRNSMAAKRNSVIRLLSESENHDAPEEEVKAIEEIEEDTDPASKDEENEDEKRPLPLFMPNPNDTFYEEEMAEIEEMREEVDEARKLAEEWEAKYKEMQRQMSDLESSRHKKHSLILDSVPMAPKKSSTASELEMEDYDDGDYSWMLKREIHSLNNKIRNIRDKREIVMRERRLLQERIETLIGSIKNEVDSRKRLRKEINDMNDAFKQELKEMSAEQKAAEELEECYFSDDEDLVINTHNRGYENEDSENDDLDEENCEDNFEEIIKEAEEEYEDEEDAGAELFEHYPQEEDEDIEESEIAEEDYEPTREMLNKRVERHNENVQLMRRSNFMLKGKIDRLYDILQEQKEKHVDLRQELTRMLADIQ